MNSVLLVLKNVEVKSFTMGAQRWYSTVRHAILPEKTTI